MDMDELELGRVVQHPQPPQRITREGIGRGLPRGSDRRSSSFSESGDDVEATAAAGNDEYALIEPPLNRYSILKEKLMHDLREKLTLMLGFKYGEWGPTFSRVPFHIGDKIYSPVLRLASNIPYTDVKTLAIMKQLENEFMAIATKKLAEEEAKLAEENAKSICPASCVMMGGRSYKYRNMRKSRRNMRKSRRNMRKSRRKSRK